MKRMLMTALASAIALAAAPGQALAGDTLGSSMQNVDQNTPACEHAAGCLLVQEALPEHTTAAPYDGVVVRWRIRGSGAFSVFPVSYSGDDTIIRRAGSATEQVPSRTSIAVFGTRFPIAAGQRIGLAYGQGASIAYRDQVPGADIDFWWPARGEGDAGVASGSRDVAGDVAYSATIEPDADRDGFGDETQDLCPGDASVQTECGPQPAPSTPGTGDAVDTTPPSLTGARIIPRTLARRRGGKLRLTLSEPAGVSVAIQRCTSKRRKLRCRNFGVITQGAAAGRVAIAIGRRIGRRSLRRGRYRAIVKAVDASGNAARPLRLRFAVR